MRTLARDAGDDARSPMPLGGAIDAAVQLTSNELRHRATLVRDLRETPLVAADETRLTQVLVNLLSNAGQAIEEGHSDRHVVRLATYTSASGEAVIEVTDDGCGIAPENVPRVFDPFFTTKPIGVGTGLGLAIAHGIVTSFGGEIAVESTVGVGTTVRIRLPAAAAPAEAPTGGVHEAQASAKRPRVLIVDDEPAVARVMARALSRDIDTVLATNGESALAELARGAFDAVVSDVMMPIMDGPTLFREITRLYPAMASRVVFMSGGAFTPKTRDFLATVPNERVEKPLNMTRLKEILANVIGTPRER
jgi:CheY-like chemotaxis protein/anti-sigma regulatory factor (Ser/Thr protein kinase)